MAARIHILDPVLADQIAAGEVIERAASVVKELVENSLDAGARKIDVEIVGGGRTLIRVVDDGCGMSPEDARLSVERHATSKLARADDLWGLKTFGFRGEALPSIAAVSKFSLATRPADLDEGIRIDLEGGRHVGEQAVGMAPGTRIEVRELFFNTPARLKFQKTEVTEAANVSEALLKLSLANPEVHVRLRSNGRVALDLPPHRDLGERVRAGLARRGGGGVHEAIGREALPQGSIGIHAFLGAPEDASTTTRTTFLFVGRRCVRDRLLLQALCMGYGELLERGRYPLAALFIDPPAAEVDVNVHPQKLEVRFANAQRVQAAVRRVVREAVVRAPWLREPLLVPARDVMVQHPREREGGAPRAPLGPDQHRASAGARAFSFSLPPAFGARDGAQSSHGRESLEMSLRAMTSERGEAPVPTAPVVSPRAPGVFSRLRCLGQFNRSYLVCEAEGELVLIDQQAAHEQIVRARLRAAYQLRGLARRNLLFPVPIEIDAKIAAQLPALLSPGAVLANLGFEAESFGERTLLLRAVPEPLLKADPKPLVLAVLECAVEDGTDDGSSARVEQRFERILSALACQAAVRAGDLLSLEEMQSLLSGLDELDVDAYNPHGRPVVVRISASELARRFRHG